MMVSNNINYFPSSYESILFLVSTIPKASLRGRYTTTHRRINFLRNSQGKLERKSAMMSSFFQVCLGAIRVALRLGNSQQSLRIELCST